jgi:hypothetical protein
MVIQHPQCPAIVHSQDFQEKAETLESTWQHGWSTLALLKSLKACLHQYVSEILLSYNMISLSLYRIVQLWRNGLDAGATHWLQRITPSFQCLSTSGSDEAFTSGIPAVGFEDVKKPWVAQEEFEGIWHACLSPGTPPVKRCSGDVVDSRQVGQIAQVALNKTERANQRTLSQHITLTSFKGVPHLNVGSWIPLLPSLQFSHAKNPNVMEAAPMTEPSCTQVI